MEKICPAPHIATGRWAALRSRIYHGADSAGITAARSSNDSSTSSSDVATLAQPVIKGKERKRQLGSGYAVAQRQVN